MRKEKNNFSFDGCLSCTACMSICPVMAATPYYKGPKLVGVAHERMHFAEDDIEDSLEYCTNCKNCDRTCPSGVSVSTINMLHRAEYYRSHPHSKIEDLLAHHERLAKLVRKLPLGRQWANMGIAIGGRLRAFKSVGLAKERHLPYYAKETFYNRFKRYRQKPTGEKFTEQILIFPGCTINENEPNVGMALVKIMNANGIEVIIDERFRCCGSPMMQLGYLDEAYENAKHNVARILDYKDTPIVCCCPSCSLAVKQEYGDFFDDENFGKAARNVYDAFEYLELLANKGTLIIPTGKDDLPSLFYHAPCHLKSQGIGLPTVTLLRKMGLSVTTSSAYCCGMAGSFGFMESKYKISMKIGQQLFDEVNTHPHAEIISDCNSCRRQIMHGTGRKVISPLKILAYLYEVDE